LAITINAKDNNVANVVIVVDAFAILGIFKMALLSIIKLILVSTAKTMAAINFQLNNILKILLASNKLPDIRDRSPIKTMEIVLVKQNASSQKITRSIADI